jgi:hypothetical protein
VHICGDLIALGAGTIGGPYCHYDAATHQLVGATEASDLLTFCGQASSTRSAGRRQARSCLEAPPAIERSCSGAGG